MRDVGTIIGILRGLSMTGSKMGGRSSPEINLTGEAAFSTSWFSGMGCAALRRGAGESASRSGAAKRRNGACATGHFKTSQSEVGYSDQFSGFRPAV